MTTLVMMRNEKKRSPALFCSAKECLHRVQYGPCPTHRPALKLMDITLVVRMAAPTLAEGKQALAGPISARGDVLRVTAEAREVSDYPGGMVGNVPAFNAENIAHVERGSR